MSWQTQFTKEYEPPATIKMLAEAGKIIDISWGNDVCPSYCIPGASGVRIWVDAANPELREMGGKRVTVSLYDEEENWLSNALETDSMLEFLKYLEDHWDMEL